MKSLYTSIFSSLSCNSIYHSISKTAETPVTTSTTTITGFIRSIRTQKNIIFISLYDGTKNIQLCMEKEKYNYIVESKNIQLSNGCSIIVEGTINDIIKKDKNIEVNDKELVISNFDMIGNCDSTYPLQKKYITLDVLRSDMLHLRSRSNTMINMLRIRNHVTMEIHNFLQKKQFINIHTPIITSLDAEGAGDMFNIVSSSKDKDNKGFFGDTNAYLTVSGQLHAEMITSSIRNVYTFGPTFRAEHSQTNRHLAEFWMMEPEMAFSDLNSIINNSEELLKHVINSALINMKDEIKFFNEFYDKDLIKRLEAYVSNSFIKITYDDAIKLLLDSKVSFKLEVKLGSDLSTEHEKWLAEHYSLPVYVTNYPKEIKSFYMKENADGRTVENMDLLFPILGEIIGGSQREDNYDILLSKMKSLNMKIENYEWYLDLRKYGSTPHSGYGLGFERLIQVITGLTNIRDVVIAPRSFGSCKL